MEVERATKRLPTEGRRRLLEAVGAPGFIEPWLDRFYDAADAKLVLAATQATPSGSIVVPNDATRWAPAATEQPIARVDGDAPAAAQGEAHPDSMDVGAALHRAWRRGVLDRRESGSYVPATFHTRLEYWALFEGWVDIPDDIRGLLCAWESAYYTEGLRERVAALKGGAGLRPGERGAEYLLPHEAEALLHRAEHIYLWPCNCRAYVGGCQKPSLVCLRFENDRDTGWEVSTERAVEIMRRANRRGLMQVGEVPPGAGPVTAGALCNCCSDCCFEQQASRVLDAARVWPLSRYVAVLPDHCTRCGKCARRCPFGAITMTKSVPDEGDGRNLADEKAGVPAEPTDEHRRPLLDASHCRGCGVCAGGCPNEAIAMLPLLCEQRPV